MSFYINPPTLKCNAEAQGPRFRGFA